MAGLAEADWSSISSQIGRERVLPLIGDGFFWELAGGLEALLQAWAEYAEYPGDQAGRTQLADHVLLEIGNEYPAKQEYLDFLKGFLLGEAESSGSLDRAALADLQDKADEMTVSEIGRAIGLETLAGQSYDAYRFLANLDLPIYITTGYHDFLEQALQEAGKKPHSQLCLWRDDMLDDAASGASSQTADYTPGEPLVFHLFGLDSRPESLVLGEEDHLHFLTNLALNPDIVPPVVRQAMALSSLLLLGFQMREWDFRVAYRGLILSQTRRARRLHVATQRAPQGLDEANQDRARHFVEQYFDGGTFKVFWGSDEVFLRELWQRRGR